MRNDCIFFYRFWPTLLLVLEGDNLRQEDVDHFPQNPTDFVHRRGSSFAYRPEEAVLPWITVAKNENIKMRTSKCRVLLLQLQLQRVVHHFPADLPRQQGRILKLNLGVVGQGVVGFEVVSEVSVFRWKLQRNGYRQKDLGENDEGVVRLNLTPMLLP